MINKLIGRDKVVWLTVANKVNEIIDELENIRQILENNNDTNNNATETNEVNLQQERTG